MLEVGFAVARRDGSDRTAPAPPRVLHPFLRFDRVNARVLRAVLEALESDEGFRDRVAAAGPMSEPSVGAPAADAAAWLFLERPDGWEQELDALLSAGAEIDQAEIAGRFEGTITVRQRLFIRSTGKVVGTIRYGTVEIEAGGEIAGDVQVSGG